MPSDSTPQQPGQPETQAHGHVPDQTAAQAPAPTDGHGSGRRLGLALAALGVVYGDIGTSPLYAVKECFHGPHAVPLSAVNIMGVLSLILWSLIIVVSVKYVVFMLRADNKGEGGVFALLSLLSAKNDTTSRAGKAVFVFMAMFGAALLYGDGIITPAISVLSAMEGLGVATDAAQPFIVPGTCLVLVSLFMVQKHGTARIGRIFGPVMILWFAALAALGLAEVVREPAVLAALNPWYAARFFMENHLHGMVVLGSVILCITGGEALYADMGHFGRGPIRLSWCAMVMPALMLNYFGQGALLLSRPETAFNPFYALVPETLLYPMVALATAATVIASQAMISGVYSLTQQAVQLGFCPRIRIVNTSAQTKGQIYLPGVNTALMFACLGLVLAFRSSSGLAAAYGIAVTIDMTISSLFFFLIARMLWGWSLWKALPLVALFLLFDLSFLGSNLLKVTDGGWFTLTVAALIMTAMATWRQGKAALGRQFQSMGLPIELFLQSLTAGTPPLRVPGTGVFMSVSPTGTPITLLHHYKHNKVLHEQVLLLSVGSADTPFVPAAERIAVTALDHGFFRITARYGFMQTPSVPEILRLARARGIHADMSDTSFYLGRESLLTSGPSKMMRWRKSLFAFMSRNAWNATTFFGIPPGRVVELGTQVEL
ncbi:KUP system potassium uptake protein [Humidesulfovibrio mexicanus]|uniref:Probable potassium transport system protein Kup n=1 Tax=Humidesulfovibrio mexicanus TaxID=147047 RepID=A0A239CLN9_9BACT|nr:potassium transporter Kup [Humidesulfovibrio mexicanus]SNS20253.1 KUP system potassium uptake protein [Humidesulfovibrio mexicanus]